MASITGKTHLFFVTSPRSPFNMKDEINVLINNYEGKQWRANTEIQASFYRDIVDSDFYRGKLTPEEVIETEDKKVAFHGRDRITRAPKSLGIVNLDPIELTSAGNEYIYGKRPSEAFTRQLLKFQFPSPFHIDKEDNYAIKPYLELFRLINDLYGITKDEIAAFATHMINYNQYDAVKNKIANFRKKISNIDRTKTNYNRVFDEVFNEEIINTYESKISEGDINIRENPEAIQGLNTFLYTKKRNHKDYADAAIRYLRETKLVTLKSSRSTKLITPEEKIGEVKFILKSVSREPVHINDKDKYKEYLFDSSLPKLLTDDQEKLKENIIDISDEYKEEDLSAYSINELKDVKEAIIQEKIEKNINKEIRLLRSYELYDDIKGMYKDILSKDVIDRPLMFEWNTWRAFNMLNDGEIMGNFRIDDTGKPLSTAPGKTADITCKYEDFDILLEVTLSSGATQWKMEGEPVPRHVGNHQKEVKKDTYCLFIAPNINEATIAHFYLLHQQEISYYGGKAKIIPISLDDLSSLLDIANEADKKPNRNSIHKFIYTASELALEAGNEKEWYDNVKKLASNWLDL